ncbi:hypothetical protein DPMN_084048 [Dreissena polymorpha]|uniref:Uncharacterized protein n=1 Tax=Dreissena polymorpha TaxID=45954 RepID=A0A9D3YDU4_DREPO|nr:hypothetical protein DPMN_084048 [Dreissena polymorpha]
MTERDTLREVNEELKCSQLHHVGAGDELSQTHQMEMLSLPAEIKYEGAFESCSGKLRLNACAKVLSWISLCSLHMLIRVDNLLPILDFCLEETLYKLKII